MRALLPVACVAVFGMAVRYAWRDVHDAITNSTGGPPPYLAPQPPVVYRPPVAHRPPVVEDEEKPVADDRTAEPGAAPPARSRPRAQYADPHAPPPARVHPAERVMQGP